MADIDLTAILARLEALESEPRVIQLSMGINSLSGATRLYPQTDQATYTELWRGDFYSTGQVVYYDFEAWPDTEMDFKIECYENAGSPATAFELTGITSVSQIAGTFTIPTGGFRANTGTNRLGRFLTLRVHAAAIAGTYAGISVNQLPFTLKR